MADVEKAFATVDELKERWPDFPPGGEKTATVKLLDASQFIVDMCPMALSVSVGTRRRVVCSVVRRSMQSDATGTAGFSQIAEHAGPFGGTFTPANPHGDFYLTAQEKKVLGGAGGARATSVPAVVRDLDPTHRPWCSLTFGAKSCSCGASLTGGQPLWEP